MCLELHIGTKPFSQYQRKRPYIEKSYLLKQVVDVLVHLVALILGLVAAYLMLALALIQFEDYGATQRKPSVCNSPGHHELKCPLTLCSGDCTLWHPSIIWLPAMTWSICRDCQSHGMDCPKTWQFDTLNLVNYFRSNWVIFFRPVRPM